LLGNKLNIPLTKINISNFDRVDLSRYTTLILTDGVYKLSPQAISKLQQWIANGGTLITSKGASEWVIEAKIATDFLPDSLVKTKPVTDRLDYITQRENEGPKRIGGVIFNADLDITNPLAFGFSSRELYALKSGNYVLPKPNNNYATVLQLTENPPISGYLSKENQAKLKNAPLVVFEKKGRGTIVLFSESPTFRNYWLSTGRLLTNAIFFGDNLSLGGRYRP
jgi:hypothetical protein